MGKCIISFTLVGDAVMLYFVNNYDVLVTDEMMGNVLNTQYSEASGFFSFAFILYLILGIAPSVYVFMRKLEYGSWKRLFANVGITVGLLLAAVFGNMKNWPWIDKNSTELGSLIREHEELALDRQEFHGTGQSHHALVLRGEHFPL